MRSALRRLILSIPILFALFVVTHLSFPQAHTVIYEHLPNVPNVGIPVLFGRPGSETNLDSTVDTALDGVSSPSAPNVKTPATKSALHEMWNLMSKAIYEARPQVPAIVLQGHARTERPPDGAKVREPYRQLIKDERNEIQGLTDAHQLFMKELDKYEVKNGTFSGRGIATVGGGEYFGPAIIGIHILRRSGSTLPVEVFVPDRKEYNAELCEKYLPKLDATCVILSEILAEGFRGSADLSIGHYQYKAMAVLFSSFEEVLLLDSDSMVLVDPEKDLFNVEPYVSSGLVIWPDFWAATETPKFYEIAGLAEFPSGLPPTSSETGQVLINKKMHFKTLLLATYYNVFGPKYYYPLLSQGALGQGDKETFMAAAVVRGAPYYRVQSPVSALGRHTGTQEKGTAMVQHLPSDDMTRYSPTNTDPNLSVRAAFLHANTPKMNAGHLVDEGDLFKVDGKTRLRLLGSEKQQQEEFGFDLEKAIWELLVQTGCELAHVLRDWKSRSKMCVRLEEHYAAIFNSDI